ncbi:protein of unknown function [Nitrosomonas marina]|uniref:DUF4124 domain-containing protein n=1 Tax=Nitrosomonas marina TaxID=917 RepID=A0A1H9Y2X2_9PROT|nr:DUF4124 domain-containing protein [Nitrosomonas marina]SES63195.1 protein of unknown function [Nitrosomonas marina]
MRYLIFIVSVLSFSLPVSAQLFKWVDEQGKTQYSDQPPPSANVQNEQQLKIQASPTPVSAASTMSDTETDKTDELVEQRLEYDKRRQERLKKEAQRKTEAAENQKKCVDAQSRLRVFSESPRLRIPDGKGGLVYADDNLRQQKIDEANESIKTFCK